MMEASIRKSSKKWKGQYQKKNTKMIGDFMSKPLLFSLFISMFYIIISQKRH